MAKIEPTLAAIEQRLADPSIYEQSNKDELKAVLKQQGELKEAMEVHEIEWMDAVEQLDKAEAAYR
jgi:ATP-binding cassette, subfamily F, member 3